MPLTPQWKRSTSSRWTRYLATRRRRGPKLSMTLSMLVVLFLSHAGRGVVVSLRRLIAHVLVGVRHFAGVVPLRSDQPNPSASLLHDR